MRLGKSERTDLVISMTLAELFLLILFVVWYGYSSILGNPDDAARSKEQMDLLRKENQKLARELSDSQTKVAELQKKLDIWRSLTGFEGDPPSRQAFQQWVKDVGRGNPKCEENNILIHASVVKGKVSMELLMESSNLSRWFTKKGYSLPRVNVKITKSNAIQEFLDRVRDFYLSSNKEGPKCRFDYSLTYGSKEDYYDARELFERYFYPAGITRSGMD